MKQSVVTGGDAAYFPLIAELLASIRRRRAAHELDVAVLDCGLQPEQVDELKRAWGVRVLNAYWEYCFRPSRTDGREHLKTQIARAFLDVYCPHADLICWIDADAWVQDIAALDQMFAVASTGKLAVVSQASRYGATTMSLQWRFAGHAEVRSILYKNARQARVPERDARQIGVKGTLNTGVFALAREAPHWEAWRARQAQIIRKARLFSSDQLSLSMAVYLDDLPLALMPETCNYTGPLWRCSDDGSRLVEYYPPYNQVGIVHLAGLNEMRADPEVTLPIETMSGEVIHRSLRQPAWASPRRKAA